MEQYKKLMKFYSREQEDFVNWLHKTNATTRSMTDGKNVNSPRAFRRKFASAVCARYDIKNVPGDWLPDLLEKVGLPDQWRELVWLTLVELAQDDFKISKVK